MNTPVNKNKVNNSSLDALISEAEGFFKLLDNNSAVIDHFEKSMAEMHVYVPFRLCIEKEQESSVKNLVDHHKDIMHAVSFSTQIRWYLAWEPLDESSKKYRLFLISEEQEIVHIEYGEFLDNVRGDESCIKPRIIDKQVLIETNAQTRFKYAEYLNWFIDSFRAHLQLRRLAIENNSELPF